MNIAPLGAHGPSQDQVNLARAHRARTISLPGLWSKLPHDTLHSILASSASSPEVDEDIFIGTGDDVASEEVPEDDEEGEGDDAGNNPAGTQGT